MRSKSIIDQLQSSYYQVEAIGAKVTYRLTSNRPHGWVTYDEISSDLKNAIVISEDWAFYNHNGVDLNQLKEALLEFFYRGRRLRGASTITQQVVKNLFFSSGRSYLRKIHELPQSIYLDKVVSKKKILEIYLNIVEFGKGIYGVEAASKYYFLKYPHEINAKEAAFLAMLLPSPKKYAFSFRQKELTEFAKDTVNDILLKMLQVGHISYSEYNAYANTRFFWEFKQPSSISTEERPVHE